MFVLNIIDSKELKTQLRRLFVGHHSEYDFSDSEDDFCELLELTQASVILMQAEYDDVQGRYILNHIHKFCSSKTIERVVVLYDDPNEVPLDLKEEPLFELTYHSMDHIDDTLLNKLEGSSIRSVEPKKILYVSDDHFMQIIVQDIIHKNTDFEIVTASNGAEGLEKYEDLHPNLVLTDLVMPEIDGMELCKRIKIGKQDDQTHVIIFSSTSDEATIEQAYTLKAKAYIVKPIQPEKFLRKINRILS